MSIHFFSNRHPNRWLLILPALFVFMASIQAGHIGQIAAVSDSTRTDSTYKVYDRSYTFNIDCGNDLHYRSRGNEIKLPYYSPGFNYESATGYFVFVSFTDIVTSKNDTAHLAVVARKRVFDAGELNFGRDFNIGKKIDASLGLTRYFFSEKDKAAPNSDILWNLEYSMNFKFKYLREKIILDFDRGIERDMSIAFMTYRRYSFKDVFQFDDEIFLKPKFTLNLGTQNFYKISRASAGNKLTRFSFTSLNLSLVAGYTIGIFTLEPTLVWSKPMNLPVNAPATPIKYGLLSVYLDF